MWVRLLRGIAGVVGVPVRVAEERTALLHRRRPDEEISGRVVQGRICVRRARAVAFLVLHEPVGTCHVRHLLNIELHDVVTAPRHGTAVLRLVFLAATPVAHRDIGGSDLGTARPQDGPADLDRQGLALGIGSMCTAPVVLAQVRGRTVDVIAIEIVLAAGVHRRVYAPRIRRARVDRGGFAIVARDLGVGALPTRVHRVHGACVVVVARHLGVDTLPGHARIRRPVLAVVALAVVAARRIVLAHVVPLRVVVVVARVLDARRTRGALARFLLANTRVAGVDRTRVAVGTIRVPAALVTASVSEFLRTHRRGPKPVTGRQAEVAAAALIIVRGRTAVAVRVTPVVGAGDAVITHLRHVPAGAGVEIADVVGALAAVRAVRVLLAAVDRLGIRKILRADLRRLRSAGHHEATFDRRGRAARAVETVLAVLSGEDGRERTVRALDLSAAVRLPCDRAGHTVLAVADLRDACATVEEEAPVDLRRHGTGLPRRPLRTFEHTHALRVAELVTDTVTTTIRASLEVLAVGAVGTGDDAETLRVAELGRGALMLLGAELDALPIVTLDDDRLATVIGAARDGRDERDEHDDEQELVELLHDSSPPRFNRGFVVASSCTTREVFTPENSS